MTIKHFGALPRGVSELNVDAGFPWYTFNLIGMPTDWSTGQLGSLPNFLEASGHKAQV